MVGGQTVAQPHRQIECPGVVHRFECSFHAHQYTITDGGLLFSDKLLADSVPVLLRLASCPTSKDRCFPLSTVTAGLQQEPPVQGLVRSPVARAYSVGIVSTGTRT